MFQPHPPARARRRGGRLPAWEGASRAILDIVIDTINQRTGGGTRYINQRVEDFIHSAFIVENYRKQFPMMSISSYDAYAP